MTKRLLCACALGALLGGAAAPLAAQEFPKGPISLVVPLAPGDAGDIASRALAEEMSRSLKVAVVPINRPGAGGGLGVDLVVKSARDGNTIILAQNAALTFRAVMEPKAVSYTAARDLTSLGVVARTPSILAVRSDAPFKTFAELLQYAKANPGKVRIGTAGSGSVGEFCVEVINALTGAGLVAVPFKGASPVVTALRGGHIEGAVLALGALAGQIKGGALRGVVISSRFPDFADVPTLTSLGYREELFGVWFGMYGPAGIPEEARKALVAAVEQATNSPAVAAKLVALGIVTDYAPPARQIAEIESEIARVEVIARKNNLIK